MSQYSHGSDPDLGACGNLGSLVGANGHLGSLVSRGVRPSRTGDRVLGTTVRMGSDTGVQGYQDFGKISEY